MRPRFACRAAALLAPVWMLLIALPVRATMPPRVGPVAPELASAFQQGLFEVPPHPQGLATSSSRDEWVIPIIRVSFPDSGIVYPKAAMEQRLFDTTGAVPTGSMAEYYRWASGGRLKVRGEVVATVMMPHDRNYYAADAWGVNALGTPNNSYGLFRDAVSACDATVDFSRFDMDNDGYVDMLWIVHAGPGGENTTSRRDLWSITSRATASWNNGSVADCNDLVPGTLTQHMRIDRFTILPELSSFHPGQLSEIGVYAHEFGHTLGLPDLYDTSQLGGTANVGPGNWTLMSTGAYGGDGASPESPSHLGAWCMLWLGWAARVRPTQDTTLVLRPVADGGPVIDFWFQGEDSPEHFLLENRVREQFDKTIPAEGLLIHQVDEAVVGPRISANRINTGPTPGMRVLEADGDFDLYYGANRGDPNDPFPGQLHRTHVDDITTPSTRTFLGAPTNISLDAIQRVGTDVSLTIHVRAPGWLPPVDMEPGASEPVLAFGPGTRAEISPSGHAWHVSSELVNGTPSVLVRDKPWLGTWQPPTVVDRGRGAATDPTLTMLGHEDLAIAWIETENGVSRICYRARVLGRWGSTAVLSSTPGGSLAPSIAADARGRVFVAWLEVVFGRVSVRFMQFLYSAPYGQPITVTTPVDQPNPPLVTAAGDGHAYLLWPDNGTGTQIVYACRFQPDSGLSARFRVTPNTPYAQPSVGAAVDTAGTLHVVWQQTPGAGGEIHYQRRPAVGRGLRDTTLDALGDGLQNPRIALDPSGGMHVSYERSVSDGLQLRYKRWRPDLGWDHRATEVSDDADKTAVSADLLPTSNGNVMLTWIGFDGLEQHLRERTRLLDGTAVTDVPVGLPHAAVAMRAGPNPVRAGEALEFSGAAIAPGAALDLLDTSGRRVASMTADPEGRVRLARGVTAGFAPGLYFARVRSTGQCGRVVVLH